MAFSIKVRASLVTFVISMMTVLPLMADDTEIYLGQTAFSTGVRPNLLFIIDTSGSMDSQVLVTTGGDYDPTITYSGACSTSRIYWDSYGYAPSCYTSHWFYSSSNQCADSSAALSTGSGLYVGWLARYRTSWRTDRWRSLSSHNHSNIVDCAADWGIHGDGGSDHYPANQNKGGPYRANKSGAINWNRTGGSYTLYSGNYLNWKSSVGAPVIKTRLQIVKEVFNNMIDSTSGVNASVMRFDNKNQWYNKGGYFLLPMLELNDSTRPTFKTAVNSLTAGGYTPLAETMYEAARFYRGEGVKFGNSTTPGTNDPGVLKPADSTKYKSPIEFQCQQNFIVMLTDGDPTYDSDADNDIQSLPGLTDTAGTCSYSSDDCLDELAQYLFEVDQQPNLSNDQVITSYMIGFNTNQALLQSAAQKGGGKYYTADNVGDLTNAFTNIITEILSVNTTFVAPAAPVNAFNRFTHRNELYFALFRPDKFPLWDGNVKRYQVAGDPPIITDANGAPAVNAANGYFSSSATSFWTQAGNGPDGDKVASGGAANRLALPRKTYTYTGTTSPVNALLTTSNNKVNETNTLLTKSMLGITGESDAYRTTLLKWSRGVDVDDVDGDGDTTDIRNHIGDPLHSNPIVVNYSGTSTSPDDTLYVATNEGFLHAIDTDDGTEVFSFIPQELLPNLNAFYRDSSTTNRPYGLDGPITINVRDLNNNGIVLDTNGNVESGEFVHLYVGMRRGGKNYYALDVTDRTSPVLKWAIKGGQGDFTELAQTWSRPQLARIKSNGAPKTVLLFGGGYDTNQDTEITGVDTEGRAVYMVDEDTGARLWWAGGSMSTADLKLPSIEYGFPATVVAADINADGYTDVFFAIDINGQLFRFDIDNSGSDSVIKGGLIARLSGTGTGENRRFYERPDVSLMYRSGQIGFAIGVGSGYRAHPLVLSTQDRYYMLFTGNVHSAPATYTVLTESDLKDVTTDLNPSLGSKSGWYINLSAGEKVMARSRTVNGMTLFTTFRPDSGSQICSPAPGRGSIYAVNSYNAAPTRNLDGVGTLEALTLEDRSRFLVHAGIQPEPTLIFVNTDHPLVVVGTEQTSDIPLNLPLERTSWQDQ